jgi:hypothetical protein
MLQRILLIQVKRCLMGKNNLVVLVGSEIQTIFELAQQLPPPSDTELQYLVGIFGEQPAKELLGAKLIKEECVVTFKQNPHEDQAREIRVSFTLARIEGQAVEESSIILPASALCAGLWASLEASLQQGALLEFMAFLLPQIEWSKESEEFRRVGSHLRKNRPLCPENSMTGTRQAVRWMCNLGTLTYTMREHGLSWDEVASCDPELASSIETYIESEKHKARFVQVFSRLQHDFTISEFVDVIALEDLSVPEAITRRYWPFLKNEREILKSLGKLPKEVEKCRELARANADALLLWQKARGYRCCSCGSLHSTGPFGSGPSTCGKLCQKCLCRWRLTRDLVDLIVPNLVGDGRGWMSMGSAGMRNVRISM